MDCLQLLHVWDNVAATNMLAISFARKDKELAGHILSDALAIAAVLGVLLAAGMYAAAPAYLQRLAGQASAAVVEPAVTYVRIRWAPHPDPPLPLEEGWRT